MKESFPVSLVIPVYNESKTIEASVETIKLQTFSPAEIILVDAGSSDNTVELINTLTGDDPRFSVIKAGRAMPGEGRNIGISNAKYDWIAFTDAGIKLDKYWLEQLVKKSKENPEASIIYGNYSPQINNFFDKCSAITFVPAVKPGSIRGKSIASCLLKKEVWEKVGGFPGSRATEDIVFMEKAEQLGYQVALAPDAKVYWQLRPNLISAFQKFDLYSKYNVWAGLQAKWQYPVARQYAVLLVIIALGIFHSNYWFFLLPLWIIARVGRRIYMHRRELGIKELFNPLTFLGVIVVTLTMDAGTFSGWAKAFFLKPPKSQNNQPFKSNK